MTDLFDGPGSADQLNLETLEGQLLLIKPDKQLNVSTAFGPKDAIEADVHILDGSEAGNALKGSYIFPLVLQGQIRSNIGTGRLNLGRLGKGVAKPGQKPPWRLVEPTDGDKELARKYLDSDKYKSNTAVAAEPVAAVAEDDKPPF